MQTVKNSLTGVNLYSEIFIRLVSLVFLFAFIDSVLQFNYLIGENGCAPVRDFLNTAHSLYGSRAFFKFPGLFWISSTNLFISCVFILGIISSLLSVLGISVSLNLLISFICWLSVVNSGSDFFIYIWDTLLLEAGFIAFLVSFVNHSTKYDRLIFFLLWLLAFRLWFSMGLVTLLYNSTVGMNASFMKFFFQNQPMPTNAAFFMYHLPASVQGFLSAILVVVEVIFPLLIFINRFRAVVFVAFFIFSILTEICGNYAWFNILTVIVCIPLLVNTSLGEKISARIARIPLKRINWDLRLNSRIVLSLIYFQIFLQILFLIFLFFPIGNRYLNFLNYYNYAPEFTSWVEKSTVNKVITFPIYVGSNFKLANPYGVFKGIPVKRWEIEFERCKDTLDANGERVKYHYKPGMSDGSSYFAPHFPRLEQQLFYESQHGSFYRHYTPFDPGFSNICWTKGFISRLKNSHDYTNMNNSMTVNAPKFVKLKVVDLSFNSWERYTESGDIWTKKEVFSFFVPDNSINCPLIPDAYFENYQKHVP
jgi:hypothetical protein